LTGKSVEHTRESRFGNTAVSRKKKNTTPHHV
jgi:hypothetical protein